MKELVEYYWNEITECGEFVYEHLNGPFRGQFETSTKHQPLSVETPTRETYWSELLWYLKTQGEV